MPLLLPQEFSLPRARDSLKSVVCSVDNQRHYMCHPRPHMHQHPQTSLNALLVGNLRAALPGNGRDQRDAAANLQVMVRHLLVARRRPRGPHRPVKVPVRLQVVMLEVIRMVLVLLGFDNNR